MSIDVNKAYQQFRLSPNLVCRLLEVEEAFFLRTGRDLSILSGFRTELEQRRLDTQGRPAAPDQLSTHRICPATGVDLRIDGLPTRSLKIALGEAAVIHGLRWGGGSPVVDGIPSDWNHFDLGPRMDPVAEAYRRERAGTTK